MQKLLEERQMQWLTFSVDWHCVFLPGHNSDVGLHWGRDNALEDRHIASHGFLVLHPNSVGLS